MSDHVRPNQSFDELLSAYLDGQVTESERRQAEGLLGSDPAAARQLSELRYVAGLMAELPRVPTPRPFTLREAQVAPRRPRVDWLAWLKPLYLRGAAALAAVCLLVLAAGDLSFQSQAPWASQQPAITQAENGGLAAEQGDPTAISGKASTSELAGQQNAGFLGLSPGLLHGLELGLALLLIVLLAASWQLKRVA